MAAYPALPLFTDAYLADTRHLTPAQHGAYLLLLMTAWRMPECSLPDDDNFLSRTCGMDKRTWNKNKDVVLAFWRQDAKHNWYQARLKDERNYVEQKRNKNSEAGKASALKRKNRDSTNVQPEANQNPTPTPTPTPTPSLSTSVDNSDAKKQSCFRSIFDYGCNLSPNLITSNSGPIHAWLNDGCDVELDCMPTIKRLTEKGSVGSWSYFTNAIADAKATRLKPMPKGRTEYEKPTNDWRANQLNAVHEAAIEYERKKHASSTGQGNGSGGGGDEAREAALAAIGYTSSDF